MGGNVDTMDRIDFATNELLRGAIISRPTTTVGKILSPDDDYDNHENKEIELADYEYLKHMSLFSESFLLIPGKGTGWLGWYLHKKDLTFAKDNEVTISYVKFPNDKIVV